MSRIKYVKRGDPLRISASDWNRIADTVNQSNLPGTSGKVSGQYWPSLNPQVTVQRFKNSSGDYIEAGTLLMLDSPIELNSTLSAATGVSYADGFWDADLFEDIVPSDASDETIADYLTNLKDAYKLVITLNGVENNAFGVAVVTGPAWTYVDVTDADHNYAKPVAGSSTYLESTDNKSWFPIMWRESGTGMLSALVRMGYSASADGGSVSLAKTQNQGQTAGVVSVKLCDADGTESGDAFNAYFTRSKTTSGNLADMARYFPYLATGTIVRIEQQGDDWFLVSPDLTYVDKF